MLRRARSRPQDERTEWIAGEHRPPAPSRELRGFDLISILPGALSTSRIWCRCSGTPPRPRGPGDGSSSTSSTRSAARRGRALHFRAGDREPSSPELSARRGGNTHGALAEAGWEAPSTDGLGGHPRDHADSRREARAAHRQTLVAHRGLVAPPLESALAPSATWPPRLECLGSGRVARRLPPTVASSWKGGGSRNQQPIEAQPASTVASGRPLRVAEFGSFLTFRTKLRMQLPTTYRGGG